MSEAVVNYPAVDPSPSLAHSQKVFVPFSEDLLAQYGLSLGDLVPFDIQYTCLRLQESAARALVKAATDTAAEYGWSDVEIEQPA